MKVCLEVNGVHETNANNCGSRTIADIEGTEECWTQSPGGVCASGADCGGGVQECVPNATMLLFSGDDYCGYECLDGFGADCVGNYDCMSAVCNSGTCHCSWPGTECGTGGDCCSGSGGCVNNVCECISNGNACQNGGDCCSGTCTSGSCAA
jgi:hypothetical protein